jgi:putative hydrolase of the HAD superfamily
MGLLEGVVLGDIKAIIFDLDGTLYTNNLLAASINRAGAEYIAKLKNIEQQEAAELIRLTKERISRETGIETPLTAACTELGGTIEDLHRHFTATIDPSLYLKRSDRIVELLHILGDHFELYVYTNNNKALAARIIELLGLTKLFRRVFTIEDTWLPKPNKMSLFKVYEEIAKTPAECLFVGDRYDVDLREPAASGSAVFLTKTADDLLGLIKIMSEENL